MVPKSYLWRTLTCTRYQRRRDEVRLQSQPEALLEEAHVKLSSLVSGSLRLSGRRMLHTLADGETDPAAVAALAHQRLRVMPADLRDSLGAGNEVNPLHRRLVRFGPRRLLQLWRVGRDSRRSARSAESLRRRVGVAARRIRKGHVRDVWCMARGEPAARVLVELGSDL